MTASSSIDVFAFIPINHVQTSGGPNIHNFDFSSGAKLRVGTPAAVDRTISELVSGRHFQMANPHEIRSLRSAEGFLYLQSELSRSECKYPGSIRDNIGRSLIPHLRTLLGCIYLCGGGENTHWYWGNFKDRPQIFVYSSEEPVDLPFAIQTFHQAGRLRGSDWTDEILRTAETLHHDLWAHTGEDDSRFSLLYHNFFLLMSLDPESLVRRNMRLQISCMALETFYIFPEEMNHLWSEEIVRRIDYVCNEVDFDIRPSIETIREARNDIVHRSGLSRLGSHAENISEALESSEALLRCTLRWAIRNRNLMSEIDARRKWP